MPDVMRVIKVERPGVGDYLRDLGGRTADIICRQANGFGVRGPYGQIPVHRYMMGAGAGAVTLEEDDENLVREVPGPDLGQSEYRAVAEGRP